MVLSVSSPLLCGLCHHCASHGDEETSCILQYTSGLLNMSVSDLSSSSSTLFGCRTQARSHHLRTSRVP